VADFSTPGFAVITARITTGEDDGQEESNRSPDPAVSSFQCGPGRELIVSPSAKYGGKHGGVCADPLFFNGIRLFSANSPKEFERNLHEIRRRLHMFVTLDLAVRQEHVGG
jgi:hypothetical protein